MESQPDLTHNTQTTRYVKKKPIHRLDFSEVKLLNIILGTTDVWWKPMLTTIPDVLLAAYNASVACVNKNI